MGTTWLMSMDLLIRLNRGPYESISLYTCLWVDFVHLGGACRERMQVSVGGLCHGVWLEGVTVGALHIDAPHRRPVRCTTNRRAVMLMCKLSGRLINHQGVTASDTHRGYVVHIVSLCTCTDGTQSPLGG